MQDGGDPNAPADGGEPTSDRPSVIARTRDRVTRTWATVLAARPRIPALDAAFDVGERDRDVAGGLLAGAVAFRLFLWLVPFALVVVTIAGWITSDTSLSTEDLAKRFGIVGVAAQYVQDASTESTTTLVIVLVVALYALLLASRSAVRAIRLAHLLAWRMPIVRFHGSTVAALWFAGGTAGLAVVAGAINTVRAQNPGPGIVLWFVLIVIYGAVWLAASRALPHPADVPIRALIPGAIVFALGTEVLHVLTVVWYANRLEHRSELYGGLGAAVVLLAWLYLLGRLAITSAVVNASLWRRAHPADGDGSATPTVGVGFGRDG